MTGGERALVRRRGAGGAVEVVADVTPHQRSSLVLLINGGDYAAHRLRGRLSASQFDGVVQRLVATGTLTHAAGRIAATALGRFDLLAEGAKEAMTCIIGHGSIRESYASGSGRHPASLRALKTLAVKSAGGRWRLTRLGEETAAAVVAAGLAPARADAPAEEVA
ncbi:MAG: hypothetical protein EKK55_22615 [Rhodocyclaceae bacterium]|nr:MAG: hypothetical protein EKK55_22615 [Rhodocyclaceae bacterium]